jgi:acetyl esterase/lipase
MSGAGAELAVPTRIAVPSHLERLARSRPPAQYDSFAASKNHRRGEKAMPFAAHHRITVAMLASLGVLATMPASAQMPPDIAEKIAVLGRVVDPEKTAPIYAPLQEKEPYTGLKVLRDAKYGPDARNLVDIFATADASGARPVLMFVHGGAYVGGNKRPPGSPFYDNVMVWAARNGMVGVNVEYRLAPQSPCRRVPRT